MWGCGLNSPQQQTSDSHDGDGTHQLYCVDCVIRRFNGQPCQHPLPVRTWPSTNTAVEDLSNLCVRESHTPSPKVTGGASKNHGPFSGSIIGFIPKLLLRTHHALHTNSRLFTRRPAGGSYQPHTVTVFVMGMKVGEASASSFVQQFTDVYTCINMHTDPQVNQLNSSHAQFARATSALGMQPESSSVELQVQPAEYFSV